MIAALGNEVIFLKRVSIGPLELDESLKPGEYRELTSEEINAIFSC
jgi:16S rRNA pseudouridine516 synthase